MKLIYISGIDGCGKTTQAQLLVERLRSDGKSAEYQWLRWEPSIVPVIKAVKTILGKNRKPGTGETRIAREDKAHSKWAKLKHRLFSSGIFRKLWLAYATRDYYRAYKKASRTWGAQYIVMDRYIFDFIIDQSLNYGINIRKFLEDIGSTAVDSMKKPDLSVLIDIPPEVGYQRKLDGTPLAYLDARRNCYLEIPATDTTLRVNGIAPVDAIHTEIYQWVTDHT